MSPISLKSELKPPESLTIGLAEAAAVFVIYNSAMPNHADIRTASAHNTDIEAARKKAAWTSAGVLGFVFLLSRDVNSFFIGGLALGAIDFLAKHSNGTNPLTGKLSAAPAPAAGAQISGASGDNASAYPMPDYADAAYAG